LENIDVLDFELSAEEITAIDGLDTGHRGGPIRAQSLLSRVVAKSRRRERLGAVVSPQALA
jgi:diketogulonate reductase-like aldo/keto reductase